MQCLLISEKHLIWYWIIKLLAFGAWDIRKYHNGVKRRLDRCRGTKWYITASSEGRAAIGTETLLSTHFLLPRSGRAGNQKMHLCFPKMSFSFFWEREGGKWLIIHYKGYIVTQNFLLICLSLGTQIPLESAAQEQELLSERFPTFRKLHNDMHDSSYFQSFVELNFYIIFFEKSH